MELKQYWAGKKEHSLLRFVILALTFGIIVEGLFLVRLSQQERVVLVPPGFGRSSPAWVSATDAGPAYLEEMTSFLLPLITNFHPGSVDARLSLFLRYVAPEQYGAVKAQLRSQAARARRNNLAQVFYLQKVEVEEKRARATGILKRYIGKTQTSEEVTTYEMSYEIRHGRPVVTGIDLVPATGIGAADRHGE
ncbi:MAG: type IV conjugative transfer system protein TraE [Nitrospiria bacterium]